jgi:hypothetical protein
LNPPYTLDGHVGREMYVTNAVYGKSAGGQTNC